MVASSRCSSHRATLHHYCYSYVACFLSSCNQCTLVSAWGIMEYHLSKRSMSHLVPQHLFTSPSKAIQKVLLPRIVQPRSRKFSMAQSRSRIYIIMIRNDILSKDADAQLSGFQHMVTEVLPSMIQGKGTVREVLDYVKANHELIGELTYPAPSKDWFQGTSDITTQCQLGFGSRPRVSVRSLILACHNFPLSLISGLVLEECFFQFYK